MASGISDNGVGLGRGLGRRQNVAPPSLDGPAGGIRGKPMRKLSWFGISLLVDKNRLRI